MHEVRSDLEFALRDRLIQDRDVSLQLFLLLVCGDQGLLLKSFHFLCLRSPQFNFPSLAGKPRDRR